MLLKNKLTTEEAKEIFPEWHEVRKNKLIGLPATIARKEQEYQLEMTKGNSRVDLPNWLKELGNEFMEWRAKEIKQLCREYERFYWLDPPQGIKLPEKKAEEIKAARPLKEYLEDSGVVLQRTGRNYKTCCPLHEERTASFVVYPESDSWYCFGQCATGGDIFNYIQKKEGITFIQALKMLQQYA